MAMRGKKVERCGTQFTHFQINPTNPPFPCGSSWQWYFLDTTAVAQSELHAKLKEER
jgi:hypothetical protein